MTEPAPPVAQPMDYATAVGSDPTPDRQGDATGGVIPYKNAPALVGYYVGIFSSVLALLGGIIGLAAGVVAIVLGILGLRKKAREPHVKGTAHAIVALFGGILGVALGLLISAMVILALVQSL